MHHAQLLYKVTALALLLVACPAITSAKNYYVFPIDVKHGRIRSRGLLETGKVDMDGSVRVGYFYAVLPLGTPAKTFHVIVDTGSTVTYVPCNDCRHCGPDHDGAPFNPSQSPTAKWVGCGDAQCKAQASVYFCDSSDPSFNQEASASGQCLYRISYAEQSSSEGKLVRDVFTFPNQRTRVPVAFGCEDGETGEIYKQRPDGILGMGNSPGAFHSQLADAGVIHHMFSLCFGFPSGGALLLGDAPVPSNPSYSWANLFSSGWGDFYALSVDGIHYGEQQLAVPRAAFSQGYRTVLDSGTTFIYLVSEAYQAFVSAASAAAKKANLKSTTDGYGDLCWSGAKPDFQDLGSIFPDAKIKFFGGGELTLAAYRYMFQLSRKGTYCLAVFDNGDAGSLIGGVATRNVLVKYDLENRRVGFADVDCRALGKMPSNLFDNSAAPAAAATEGQNDPGVQLHQQQQQPDQAGGSQGAAGDAATGSSNVDPVVAAATANAGGSGGVSSESDVSQAQGATISSSLKAAAEKAAAQGAAGSSNKGTGSTATRAPMVAAAIAEAERESAGDAAGASEADYGATTYTAPTAGDGSTSTTAAVPEGMLSDSTQDSSQSANVSPSPSPKVYWGAASPEFTTANLKGGIKQLMGGTSATTVVVVCVVLGAVLAGGIGAVVYTYKRRGLKQLGFRQLSGQEIDCELAGLTRLDSNNLGHSSSGFAPSSTQRNSTAGAGGAGRPQQQLQQQQQQQHRISSSGNVAESPRTLVYTNKYRASYYTSPLNSSLTTSSTFTMGKAPPTQLAASTAHSAAAAAAGSAAKAATTADLAPSAGQFDPVDLGLENVSLDDGDKDVLDAVKQPQARDQQLVKPSLAAGVGSNLSRPAQQQQQQQQSAVSDAAVGSLVGQPGAATGDAAPAAAGDVDGDAALNSASSADSMELISLDDEKHKASQG